MRLMVGGPPTRVDVQVWEPGSAQPLSFSQELSQDPNPRYAVVDLGAERLAQKIRVEVTSPMDGPDAHVHLWEIVFEN